MKIFKKTILITFCALISGFCTGCKNKKSEKVQELIQETEQNLELKSQNHEWFYFSNKGFEKTDKVSNSPYTTFTPWTESVRISSANIMSDDSSAKAYAIVNRLGILEFDNENVTLSVDNSLFSTRTAGNLIFYNDVPLFSVYKSAFFNDSIKNPDYKKDESQHLFLVQFDSASKISYPLINCNNLTSEPNSEVIDFFWDGLNWNCCIKTITDIKNSYSYLKWKPVISLLSISPASAKDNISISESNQEEFRSTKEQIDYKNAPQRLKNLLSGFSASVPFSLEIKNAGGTSYRSYINSVAASTEKELSAKGIISKSWSAVLFEDGTLFIEGSLQGRYILRNGKPVAVRLPKLPAGFVYSDFVISGTTLYASWEEKDFYQTGRSGFLKVDLDKTLYNIIQ